MNEDTNPVLASVKSATQGIREPAEVKPTVEGTDDAPGLDEAADTPIQEGAETEPSSDRGLEEGDTIEAAALAALSEEDLGRAFALDDGTEATIGQAVSALKEAKQLRQHHTQVCQEAAQLRRQMAGQVNDTQARVNALYEVLAPELDAYKDWDWQRVAVENPDLWRQHKPRADQLAALKARLDAKAADAMQAQQEFVNHNLQQSWKLLDTDLRHEIPGWGEEHLQALWSFGESIGLSKMEMVLTPHPAFYRLLHLAMQAAAPTPATPAKKPPMSPTTTIPSKQTKAVVDPAARTAKAREMLELQRRALQGDKQAGVDFMVKHIQSRSNRKR